MPAAAAAAGRRGRGRDRPPCPRCGKPVPERRGPRGPQPSYCSRRCSRAAYTDRRRADPVLAAQDRKRAREASHARYLAARVVLYTHCAHCNKPMPKLPMRKGPQPRYCSSQCSNDSRYARRRATPELLARDRERLRKYAAARYATPEGRAAQLAATRRSRERRLDRVSAMFAGRQ